MLQSLLLFLLLCTLACAPHMPYLHKDGRYVVHTVRIVHGTSVVQLQHIKGQYQFPTDTLKPGDTVQISFVKKYPPSPYKNSRF